MKKKLIYIADDEINICNIIKSFFLKEDFEVETFKNGQDIYDAFKKRPANMLIIDIMMPKIDGYSLCSLIRKDSTVPIIIVSAKDTEPDKIAGLTLGGDDYMTKPFSPMELVARVRSIFRRIDLNNEKIDINNSYNNIIIGDISINFDTKQVEINGKNIPFTRMEFLVLYYLASNKGRVITRNELLDKIWGFEDDVETRATDDMIKRIRRKILQAGSSLKIETIWGVGFKI